MIQSRKLKASIVILKEQKLLSYLLTFSKMLFTLRRINYKCLMAGLLLRSGSYLVVLNIYLTFISK